MISQLFVNDVSFNFVYYEDGDVSPYHTLSPCCYLI